jgi:hypothetical protein
MTVDLNMTQPLLDGGAVQETLKKANFLAGISK